MDQRMMITLTKEEYAALLSVAAPRRMRTKHLAELIVRRWLERRGLVSAPALRTRGIPSAAAQEVRHGQPAA